MRHATPLIAALFVSVQPASAALTDYVTPAIDSTWSSEGNPLRCTLQHEIRHFGTLSFNQTAGGHLTLEVVSGLVPHRVGSVSIGSLDAPWRAEEFLGEVQSVSASARPGGLSVRMASPLQHLLQELEQGRYVMIAPDGELDGQARAAYLSPVRFQTAYAAFAECSSALLSFGFDDVASTTVHFDFDRSELSPEARYRLDRLAVYLQHDERVRAIDVVGHTDSRGSSTYNRTLAAKRAEAVAAYLHDRGVAQERIVVSDRGEEWPRTSNATDRGRADNRVVTLTLQRDREIR